MYERVTTGPIPDFIPFQAMMVWSGDVMAFMAVMDTFRFSYDLYFGLELEAALAQGRRTDVVDEIEDISGGAALIVDDEIAVDFGDFRAAAAGTLQAELVD